MSMRNGVLPAGAVRTLTAIAFLQSKGRSITWRNIMEAMRLKSANAIADSMALLFKAGLISSGPDSYGGKRRGCNTIRPACRFIPAGRLKDEPWPPR